MASTTQTDAFDLAPTTTSPSRVQLHGAGGAAASADASRRTGATDQAHRGLLSSWTRPRRDWPPATASRIKLTAREFSLLSYLMRNAGGVVGKFDILSNVWDPAYEGSENVVEVYIGYLRKKIDAPYGLQTLQTIRGMGYRLDADTAP